MKILLAIVLIAILLIIAALAWLGYQSRQQLPVLGQQQHILLPCPHSGNCVNSQQGDIAALTFQTTPQQAWLSLQQAALQMGGKIQLQSPDYLWISFKSGIFGFVDDMEITLDTANKQLHIRSASRVGRSDFGANRKRIEQLRQHFMSQ